MGVQLRGRGSGTVGVITQYLKDMNGKEIGKGRIRCYCGDEAIQQAALMKRHTYMGTRLEKGDILIFSSLRRTELLYAETFSSTSARMKVFLSFLKLFSIFCFFSLLKGLTMVRRIILLATYFNLCTIVS